MKTNIDKAINFLQIYRIDQEICYLFEAKRMINRTLKERKRAQQSANLLEPKRNNPIKL